jgi:hypothetical protein
MNAFLGEWSVILEERWTVDGVRWKGTFLGRRGKKRARSVERGSAIYAKNLCKESPMRLHVHILIID